MGKKVFEVEISNTGPKGYETATVLGLPATRAEFQDALQKARIKDSRCCRNELVSVNFAGISSGQIGRDVDLLELNFLAERLALLDADGRKGLEGLIQMEQNRLGTPIPLSRFINLTFHTDLCRFMPGVSNEKELGTFLYENEMLPQAAMALLDTAEPGSRYQTALLEAYGQKYSEDQKGVFTHWGYLVTVSYTGEATKAEEGQQMVSIVYEETPGASLFGSFPWQAVLLVLIGAGALTGGVFGVRRLVAKGKDTAENRKSKRVREDPYAGRPPMDLPDLLDEMDRGLEEDR